MSSVLALLLFEGDEECLSLFGRQPNGPQVGDESALIGDVPLALPDMPSDHVQFGLWGAHQRSLT